MFLKLLAFTLLFAAPAAAGTISDEEDFFSLEKASLEEILNLKTSVATLSAVALRETPGLVTVITREELQASGARDLVDVLSLVPEFEFGVDVQNNLGLGVRGVWANEGKVLLLWDGQTYNETLYSTLQFDRFPIDQIEEIEIIKGPGSVIYGGFAETAVINIRTRSAKGLKGSEAYAALGLGGGSRQYAGYSFARAYADGELSAKAFVGAGQRSARRYADFSGASYSMDGNSALRPRNLNLHASRGGASARLILDGFSLEQRDHYTSALSTGATRINFPALFAEFKHSAEAAPGLTLEPKVNYTRSRAWHEDDDHFPYDKRLMRLTLGLTAFYKSGGADLLAGGEYFHDDAEIGSRTADAAASYSGQRRGRAHYDNHAFYAQGAFDLPFARLTAGARYDRNSHYGASLVPRVALTRLLGDFNLKAIYSQAFRAPSIENIRLNPGIDPEKSVSEEVEAGYKASDSLFISANAFHTAIKQPIVYTVINNAETYANYGRTGSRGLGAGLKYKRSNLRADAGYLYQEAHCNTADLYAVRGHGTYLLAFPRHKLTFSASVPLAAGFSLNPSAAYASKRFAYARDGSLKAFGERTVANLNLQLKDRLLPRLTLNLGVRDMFNSNYRYIQPFDGGHAPLPAPARELFMKAAYEF